MSQEERIGRKPRHRIKKVTIWKTSETCYGFSLLTKNGVAVIVVDDPTFLRGLERHIPHLQAEFKEKICWSEEELNELLVGRYCYGYAFEWEGRKIIL